MVLLSDQRYDAIPNANNISDYADLFAISVKRWALFDVQFDETVEIARARRIIGKFESADTGLVVIDGKLIEKPVLRDMYRIVAVADRNTG